MAYAIAEPCIGTKDTACVDACPLDCIHPKKNKTGRPGQRITCHRITLTGAGAAGRFRS
jgi:NAD-dependent dihydropyrimidine dehydrogenase PreA subunit